MRFASLFSNLMFARAIPTPDPGSASLAVHLYHAKCDRYHPMFHPRLFKNAYIREGMREVVVRNRKISNCCSRAVVALAIAEVVFLQNLTIVIRSEAGFWLLVRRPAPIASNSKFLINFENLQISNWFESLYSYTRWIQVSHGTCSATKIEL